MPNSNPIARRVSPRSGLGIRLHNGRIQRISGGLVVVVVEYLRDVRRLGRARDTKFRVFYRGTTPRDSRAPPHATCRTDGDARGTADSGISTFIWKRTATASSSPRDDIAADELAVIAGPSTDRVIIHTACTDRARFTCRSLACTRTHCGPHRGQGAIRRHETKTRFFDFQIHYTTRRCRPTAYQVRARVICMQ